MRRAIYYSRGYLHRHSGPFSACSPEALAYSSHSAWLNLEGHCKEIADRWHVSARPEPSPAQRHKEILSGSGEEEPELGSAYDVEGITSCRIASSISGPSPNRLSLSSWSCVEAGSAIFWDWFRLSGSVARPGAGGLEGIAGDGCG